MKVRKQILTFERCLTEILLGCASTQLPSPTPSNWICLFVGGLRPLAS